LFLESFERTRGSSPHGFASPNRLAREHPALSANDYSILKIAVIPKAHLPSENYTYS
jgi:hypothetical protein